MLSGKADTHWPQYSHLNCIRISIFINEKWEGSVIKLYQHGRIELFCTDVRQNDWWSCAPWDLKSKYSKKPHKSISMHKAWMCRLTNTQLYFHTRSAFVIVRYAQSKPCLFMCPEKGTNFWEASCPKDGWSALSKNQSYLWWLKLSTSTLKYLHLFSKDLFKFSSLYVKPTTPWNKGTYAEWMLGNKVWQQLWLFPSTLSNVTWTKVQVKHYMKLNIT